MASSRLPLSLSAMPNTRRVLIEPGSRRSACCASGFANETSLLELGDVCESAEECDSALCRSGDDGVAICTTMCATAAESGYCARVRCSPGAAPNCPSFDGHVYECAEGSGGGYYCYERCSGDPSYRCYRVTHSCNLTYCY